MTMRFFVFIMIDASIQCICVKDKERLMVNWKLIDVVQQIYFRRRTIRRRTVRNNRNEVSRCIALVLHYIVVRAIIIDWSKSNVDNNNNNKNDYMKWRYTYAV